MAIDDPAGLERLEVRRDRHLQHEGDARESPRAHRTTPHDTTAAATRRASCLSRGGRTSTHFRMHGSTDALDRERSGPPATDGGVGQRVLAAG